MVVIKNFDHRHCAELHRQVDKNPRHFQLHYNLFKIREPSNWKVIQVSVTVVKSPSNISTLI